MCVLPPPKALQRSSDPLLPFGTGPSTATLMLSVTARAPQRRTEVKHMPLLHAAHRPCARLTLEPCLRKPCPHAATASWVSGSPLLALGWAHSTVRVTLLGGSHRFLNLGVPSCRMELFLSM